MICEQHFCENHVLDFSYRRAPLNGNRLIQSNPESTGWSSSCLYLLILFYSQQRETFSHSCISSIRHLAMDPMRLMFLALLLQFFVPCSRAQLFDRFSPKFGFRPPLGGVSGQWLIKKGHAWVLVTFSTPCLTFSSQARLNLYAWKRDGNLSVANLINLLPFAWASFSRKSQLR